MTFVAAKQEEGAIFAKNQRIPKVCRIAGAARLRSNPWYQVKEKRSGGGVRLREEAHDLWSRQIGR